jgi:hypothetical protein
MVTYQDDDFCSEHDTQCKTLGMAVAGGDYFLWSFDLLTGEYGPAVRIRTSGSSDKRNAKVCRALFDLWEALNGR